MRRICAPVLATIVAVLATTLSAPAAQADVWSVKDGKDANLAFVRIDNAAKNVFLRASFHEQFGTSNTKWRLDTVRARKGVEFTVEFDNDEADVFSLERNGQDIRCAGLKGTNKNSKVLDVRVPRNCLRWKGKLPKAIRMQVVHAQFFVGPDFDDTEYDYAPGGRKHFGPWVAHN